jgi:hypothetical protein
MSPKRGKLIALLLATTLIVPGWFLPPSPGHAAEWGPLVEEIFEHLAMHMAKHTAEQVIEKLTKSDKVPTLELSDAQMKQMIDNHIAGCVRRAQDLDDQDPQRRKILGKPLLVLGPIYAQERAAFQLQCKSVLPGNAN